MVKKYKIKGVSRLGKDQLANRLRNEFKAPPTRANLENINFKSQSPTKSTKTNAQSMGIHGLRKYAGDRCMKGRSRYPRVTNLRRFVLGYKLPTRSPVNVEKIKTLKSEQLRKYARDHCIRGYSKYTKQINLRKFLINKVTKG